MLKNGLSPIMTLNDSNGNLSQMQMGGEKVSDLFNNLVIPNWSLSYNYKNGVVYEGGSNTPYNNRNKNQHNDHGDDDDIMEEDLHEKLLNLVKVDKNEIKQNVSSKKISKKNFKHAIKTKNNVTKKSMKLRNK
jgi:hypothetical protein